VACSITILGSGSGGNCTYVETGEVRLLVDAGFSGRQIRQRLAAIGRSPESLSAILITHEHSDHAQALPQIALKLGIPVYANRLTRDALEFQLQARLPGGVFETGSSFEVGDVLVETFSVPHDAQDPLGFLLRTTSGTLGVLTDLGHATKLVVDRARQANVLLLEANHDVKMLQDDTRRPWSLKQRILGRHGHLSNAAAADAVREIASENLRHLLLGHLSRDCNRPDLAIATVGGCLGQIGAAHVQVHVCSQDVPCPTLVL
jgi:phosphoribosyl 1,2-cyclic phosphodiesterase